MAENLKKLLSTLSKRGPHEVLTGDLGRAGIPGTIYAPSEGEGLPAVAFGHDWMKGIADYENLLFHLASWGIVVAAPDTEKGFLPDFSGFAADLESSLQVLAGVRLGVGDITVAPHRLGLVGHGIGASSAILTAADHPHLLAVAALYPSESNPSASAAAERVTAPGLVVGPMDNPVFTFGNAPKIAASWQGPVVYREVEKGTHSSLGTKTWVSLLTGLGTVSARPKEEIRALLTGFLLYHLNDDKQYAAFGEPDLQTKHIISLSGKELEEKADVTGNRALPFLGD